MQVQLLGVGLCPPREHRDALFAETNFSFGVFVGRKMYLALAGANAFYVVDVTYGRFFANQLEAFLGSKQLVGVDVVPQLALLQQSGVEGVNVVDLMHLSFLATGKRYQPPESMGPLLCGERLLEFEKREMLRQIWPLRHHAEVLLPQVDGNGASSALALDSKASSLVARMTSVGLRANGETLSSLFDAKRTQAAADPTGATRLGRQARAAVQQYGSHGERLQAPLLEMGGMQQPQRLRPTFDAVGTRTGRLIVTSPQLQSLPRDLRCAFEASPGHVLVEADYRAVDLCVGAQVSGDPELLELLNAGRDIHALSAADALGIAPEAVGDEQRRAAKSVNFGALYGASADTLARENNLEMADAQRFLESFFSRFRGVRAWQRQVGALPPEQVRSLAGRPYWYRGAADTLPRRLAHIGQGTAADGFKAAFPTIDWVLRHTYGEPVPRPIGVPLLPIHDSILVEVVEHYAEWAATNIERAMVDGLQRLLPDVKVEVASVVSRSWEGSNLILARTQRGAR